MKTEGFASALLQGLSCRQHIVFSKHLYAIIFLFFSMRKHFTVKSGALSLATVSMLILAGCSKNISSTPEAASLSTEKAVTESATSGSITSAFSPYKVLGNYSLRGSRTKYRGQANDQGDNIILSIDYIGERTVETLRDEKALTCGYGETNYVNMGWQYIIRYNPKTKEILLSPNDTMAAAIAPNSFEMLYAAFDPVSHSFTFQTRFTDTDGNENEVLDILSKE